MLIMEMIKGGSNVPQPTSAWKRIETVVRPIDDEDTNRLFTPTDDGRRLF
jgi:hypothetical protein